MKKTPQQPAAAFAWHRFLRFVAIWACGALAASAILPARAQNYSLTNLTLGGSWSSAYLLNSSGQAAGFGFTAGNAASHAFFATPSQVIDLGTFGGTWSRPQALNATGQVVGASALAGDSSYHAFSWSAANGTIDLTPDALYGKALLLNDAGQVAGWRQDAAGNGTAFVWTQAGGTVPLGTFGGTDSYPYGMNAGGQVVGYAYAVGNSSYRAFSWTPAGGMVDLTPNVLNSAAHAVNDSGQVIGWLQDRTGTAAFVWSPGAGLISLGAMGGWYSYPSAINSSGQVVGQVRLSSDSEHAFSWTAASGMVDLTPQLGAGLRSYAYGVTDSGVVVGYMWSNTSAHAFVWTEEQGLVNLALGGGWTHIYARSAEKVAGCRETASGDVRAFSWSRGTGVIDLGTLGGSYACAEGINAAGVIVGGSSTAANNWLYRAFRHDGSAMVDLNMLVDTPLGGLEIFSASNIADDGSILAYSSAGAVLLTPVSSVPVVAPAAPALGPIAVSADVVAVGTSVWFVAGFSDANAEDTHTAVWTWGDGTASENGAVAEREGTGTVSATHTFTAAGVYSVSLAVTDSTGRTSRVSRNIAVYDPSGGYVTGGGWIESPFGAYRADPMKVGRATFAFVSKYEKGASKPSGTTEFRFQTANLSFFSTDYEWLVVAGARGQYKGTGTLNGSGSYRFMLTAIDGQAAGGGGTDRFRIKIWHYDGDLGKDVTDYDNQINTTYEGTLFEGTAIGGGSIAIHNPN